MPESCPLNAGGDLRVQVCYAEAGHAWLEECWLPPGATVRDALLAVEYEGRAPGQPLDALDLGVFGKRCSLETALHDGDRVEIYRPLVFDPMESRRRRAELKAQGMPGMQRRRRRQG
ncbi:RnfH family protein [Kerstersia similis]|uniref:RnfH family protein n=1 Tax=Kerstersia similis TaxID=206505 RepID=UPI0039EE543A